MADRGFETPGRRILEQYLQMRQGKIELPCHHPASLRIYDIVVALDEPSDEEALCLPRRDRHVWVVNRFERQVMNGGIDQYLWNSSGNLAAECLAALDDIGAADSFEFLSRACAAAFDGLPSRDQDVRQKQLRAFQAERGCYLDDWLERERHPSMEPDLYQKLLDYWNSTDQAAP